MRRLAACYAKVSLLKLVRAAAENPYPVCPNSLYHQGFSNLVFGMPSLFSDSGAALQTHSSQCLASS